MIVDAIFLIMFGAAWSLLAMLSWIALSVPRRAHGALWAAPFAWLGGIGGGAFVPIVGLDNELGIGLSMIAALLCSAVTGWLSFRVWDAFSLNARFAKWARRNR